MKRISFLFIIACAPCIGCFKAEQISGFANSKDSLIVLYDIKETSRKEFAENLEKVNKTGPKLIAIEAIFNDLKSPEEDSLLSDSFGNINNLILSADLTSPGWAVGKNHPLFRKSHIQEGLLSYLIEEDSTTRQYIPLFQNADGQMLSFPDQIVFNFQPETIHRFRKMRVNATAPIDHIKSLEHFYVIDKDDLQPELIQDKIILVGHLGAEDDYFNVLINDHKTKTFSLVITANIVLNILSEHKSNSQPPDE